MEPRLVSFFDELEKIAGLLTDNPVTKGLLALSLADRVDRAEGLHRRRAEYLRKGVPVGWADIGMRPQEGG